MSLSAARSTYERTNVTRSLPCVARHGLPGTTLCLIRPRTCNATRHRMQAQSSSRILAQVDPEAASRQRLLLQVPACMLLPTMMLCLPGAALASRHRTQAPPQVASITSPTVAWQQVKLLAGSRLAGSAVAVSTKVARVVGIVVVATMLFKFVKQSFSKQRVQPLAVALVAAPSGIDTTTSQTPGTEAAEHPPVPPSVHAALNESSGTFGVELARWAGTLLAAHETAAKLEHIELEIRALAASAAVEIPEHRVRFYQEQQQQAAGSGRELLGKLQQQWEAELVGFQDQGRVLLQDLSALQEQHLQQLAFDAPQKQKQLAFDASQKQQKQVAVDAPQKQQQLAFDAPQKQQKQLAVDAPQQKQEQHVAQQQQHMPLHAVADVVGEVHADIRVVASVAAATAEAGATEQLAPAAPLQQGLAASPVGHGSGTNSHGRDPPSWDPFGQLLKHLLQK